MWTIGPKEKTSEAWIEVDGRKVARVCTAGESPDELAEMLAGLLVDVMNAADPVFQLMTEREG